MPSEFRELCRLQQILIGNDDAQGEAVRAIIRLIHKSRKIGAHGAPFYL